MAPQWTDVVPDWAICNWFYTFFIINTIAIVATLYIIIKNRLVKKLNGPLGVTAVLMLVVATTQTLFMYLLCDRSLEP